MRLRDLVLFNLAALIGLTWLGTAARTGPSSVTLWLLAGALFFVPQGLAVVTLARAHPDEGGIYTWAKREFGEGHGFLCGWCYWINNLLYYPSALLATSAIATYAIGQAGTGLADNWVYSLTFTLVALWLAAGLNVVGLGTGKWLQNAGGVGNYLPGLVLLALGLYGAAGGAPPANDFRAANLWPDLSNFSALYFWSTIAFAYAGLELSAAMGGEVEDPRRNLPLAVYLAAPLVALVYVCGTAALLWYVPASDVSEVSGPFQAIEAGAARLGPSLWWLAPAAAACTAVGSLGKVGAWLTGPARVAFVVGLDRYFPEAFGRVHPRWRTPYVALLVQTALATLFMLLAVQGERTTLGTAFLTLIATSLLLYFIPYLYLFGCYFAHALRAGRADTPGGRPLALALAACGFLTTAGAMLLALVPPPGASPLAYELKVAGGAAALVLAGGFIYWRARARTRR